MKQWYADSTLKSMTKDNLIGIIRCLEHNVSVEEERNQNQFNLLMKHEKYRWHDLRKNPNDLPSNDRNVYLALDMKEYVTYICGDYSENPIKDDMQRDWFSQDGYLMKNVIAWKEIEPFEVTE